MAESIIDIGSLTSRVTPKYSFHDALYLFFFIYIYIYKFVGAGFIKKNLAFDL